MTQSDRNIFQNALSDFTFETACGGAIRHLADSGCTAKQIMEKLDYPISGERVRKALYKHFCDTCVILEKSPEAGLPEAKPEYVLEYNSYGKPSYRRKSASGTEGNISASEERAWQEIVYRPMTGFPQSASGGTSGRTYGYFSRTEKAGGNSNRSVPGQSAGYPGRGAELSAYLTRYCCQRREDRIYISCDFGIPDSAAAKGISLLNGRQQEYLEGILWLRHRVYHRLDHRMKEILCNLYEQHVYEGVCYFITCKEKLFIQQKGDSP